MIETAVFSLESFFAFGTKMVVFLGGLAALIFVHELGHFLVARKCGVIVEKFALGFGPKLLGFTKSGTEYLIASIPLGGYVKMKGEDPGEELEDSKGSFSTAPVLHRLAIAFAGPLFNILFAIAIYVVVYMNGVSTLGTTIGTVRDSSPALEAGLKSGDRIVEVEGQPIQFWDRLVKIVRNSPNKELKFLIERDKKELFEVGITPVTEEVPDLFGEKERVGLIGINPLVHNISYVKEGSAAHKAGLLEGDQLVSIDGTKIRSWTDLKETTKDKAGKELNVQIKRDGLDLEIKVTPESKIIQDENGKEIELGWLGIAITGDLILEQYGFFGAIKRSFIETGKLIYLIFTSIKKMIFGSISAESIGGPILIFQIYGEQAKQGFNELIRLTALLSINLGLLNLLPIPILDGGHIFFFLIEMIKGRPVSEKNRERASQVGLFMLISLMIFAFYNDIMRIIN